MRKDTTDDVAMKLKFIMGREEIAITTLIPSRGKIFERPVAQIFVDLCFPINICGIKVPFFLLLVFCVKKVLMCLFTIQFKFNHSWLT